LEKVNRLVFDTGALLTFYLNEAGSDKIEEYLVNIQRGDAIGYLNIVNLTELYYVLYRLDPKLAKEKEMNLRLFGLKIVPVEDDKIWRAAGEIKGKYALSLADAFAVATAFVLKANLVVARDEEIEIPGVGIIRL